MARAARWVLCAAVIAIALSATQALAVGFYPTTGWTSVRTLSEPSDVVIAPDGEVFVADAGGRRIVVFSSAGSFLREFDGRSGPGTELQRPVSVTLGPDGRLYVADRSGDRVLIFERSGALVGYWGVRGSGNGQFMSPSDVAFDAAGLAYVADTFNNRVQVFSASGVWQRNIGAGTISTPSGVMVRGSELYVSETNTLRVSVYSLSGTLIRDWGWTTTGSGPSSVTSSRYLRPSGVDLDPSGAVLVSDAGRNVVENCSTIGVVAATYGAGYLALPDGLHAGPGGVLTVADAGANRLARFAMSAPSAVTTFAPLPAERPANTDPRGVAVGPDGATYVVDSAVGRVRKIDAHGETLATFAASPTLSRPMGITVARDNSEVYVCDAGNNRIVVYNASGAFLRSIGSAGSAPGQLLAPSAITELNDGTLAVADTGNNRVSVFNPDSTFVREFGGSRLRSPSGICSSVLGPIYVSDTGSHRIAVFADDGAYVRSLGGFGTAPGQYHTPQGLVMGSSGNLLVTERGNGRVQIVTVTGAPVEVFGAKGSGPGEMVDPSSAAFVSDVEIVIADAGNHRVGRARSDDVTAPDTSISGDLLGPVNRAASFSIHASDSQSGVGGMFYRYGDGPTRVYVAPVSVTEEGETIVTYWASDRAGNQAAEKTALIQVDRVAPVGATDFGTGAAVQRAGTIAVNSRVTGATEMRMGKSGALGAWIPFAASGSITVNEEGPATLVAEYRDAAGNTLTRSLACTIDGTGPVTAVTRAPSTAVSTGTVTVSLSALDARSTVAEIRYRLDGGIERRYTAPLSVSSFGAHTISAYAIDAVGNIGETLTVNFGISKLGLGGEFTVAGGAPVVGLRTVEVSTTVQGATRTRWNTGSGFIPWQPFMQSWYITFPSGGTQSVVVQFEDALGQQLEYSRTVDVDLLPPLTTIAGDVESWFARDAVFSLSAVDSPAGVARTHYRINGGTTRTYASPVTITAEGETVVTYWSVDAMGNEEAPRTATIRVDTTPPSGSTVFGTGSSVVNPGPLEVFSSVAGASEMRFGTSESMGEWMPYSAGAQLDLSAEGTVDLVAEYRDAAGNLLTRTFACVVDGTGPVTQALRTPASGISAQPVTVDLLAADALSGVAEIRYRLDGGPDTPYLAPIVVSADGAHRVDAYAVDVAGNAGPTASVVFSISRLALGGELSLAGGAPYHPARTVAASTTIQSATQMRWNAGSGFGAWKPFSPEWAIDFASDGVHTLIVEFADVFDQRVSLVDSVTVDTRAPVTTASGIPPSRISAGPVMVALEADDASPATIRYSIDGGPERTYTLPFTVTGDGERAITFYARDAAGNTEAAKTERLLIASTAPVGTLRVAGGVTRLASTQVDLEPSGPGAVRMRFDTGSGPQEWMPYARTARVTLPGEGLHWVTATFANVAGVESQSSVQVLVDLTPPGTALSGVPESGVAAGPVTLGIVATDSLTRIATTYYRVDGGAVQTYRGPFTVSGDGHHVVTHWAVDEVGNSGAPNATYFTISRLAKGGALLVAGGASYVGTLTVPVSTTVEGASGMRVDSGAGYSAWQPFASPFTVVLPREGSNVIRTQFRNDLGVNVEIAVAVLVDLTPPVTSVLGLPANGVSAGQVLLALSASDVTPIGLSEYALDGGTWRPYTSPFLVTGDGVHSLAFRSRDAVGNQEKARTISFIIDGKGPAGSLRLAGGRSIINTLAVSVDASVTGASQMRYDVGDIMGRWIPFARTSPLTLPGPGLHWVVGVFRTPAGVETTIGTPVLVDTAAPKPRAVGMSVRSFSMSRSARYTVSLSSSAVDSGSPAAGIASWQWKVGSRSSSTGSFSNVASGRHATVATAIDKAGNRGSSTASLRLGAAAAPRVPSSARGYKAFTVTGSIPSAGTGSLYAVRAYKRAANGTWVLSKTVTVKPRMRGSTAILTGRLSLGRGSYRVVLVSSRSGALVMGHPSSVVSVR